mgnify:CR=1 FL=1
MKEKFFVRLFAESEAGVVQNIIHRGLREINGKDYPAELIEKYCAYFSLEKIKNRVAQMIYFFDIRIIYFIYYFFLIQFLLYL